MDTTMIETGTNILEKISLTQPILALLLLAFSLAIVYLYKEKNKIEKELTELRKEKEAEIKEQNKLLLSIQERITIVVLDYKNVMDNIVEFVKNNQASIDKNTQTIQSLITEFKLFAQKN